MNGPAKPLPDPTDPLTGPFWAATKEGRLVVQRCDDCGYHRWPPTRICPECQSWCSQWADTPPAGEIWSHATYHRALDRAFADDVPYTVGLIQLDAGPRMLGVLVDPADDVQIGRRVEAVFDAVTPEVTLVRWRLAPSPPSPPSPPG